jgi:hypothetical protein
VDVEGHIPELDEARQIGVRQTRPVAEPGGEEDDPRGVGRPDRLTRPELPVQDRGGKPGFGSFSIS